MIEIPNSEQYLTFMSDLTGKIQDTKSVINMTILELKNFLIGLNSMPQSFYNQAISRIQVYKLQSLFESQINYHMNFCIKSQTTEQLIGGFFWSNKSSSKLQQRLGMDERHVEINIQNSDDLIGEMMPPSSFPLNAFTGPFQEIVNTYGVPNYKEFNPTVFTIITFPFLFAVMFGDVAHGSMLLLLGLFLICFEKWRKI